MDGSVVVSPPYLAEPLRLEPFRALQLDPSKVGNPATARLYARPYRSVPTRVKSWTARGDIVADSAPALYLHEYADGDHIIRGVVGALDLARRADDARNAAILPHEGIHPDQARDLAERMREMKLNPAPILLVQHSPSEARRLLRGVREHLPIRQYLDRSGQRHRIWAIRESRTIDALNTVWGPTRALIADGHHRYAAYLENQADLPDGPADLGLAMLVDQGDTPLNVAAIHRVLTDTTLGGVRAAADVRGLRLVEQDRTAATAALDANTIAVTDGRRWATITLPIEPLACAVEQLDSELIPFLPRPPRRIHYEPLLETALARTRRARAVVVVLPALTIDQIWQSVDRGRLLPEKATSFQPKPHTGVFIRALVDAQAVH